MTLRLLEHYASFQGEGPRTGEATQFVRFAGCNLRCPGWPCDTPFAIDPKLFRPEQKKVDVIGLVSDIQCMARDTFAYNICLTGGEPMLQVSDEIEDLVTQLANSGDGYDIEMFSNGTLEYPPNVLEHCEIRMDWKLPGSGEYRHSNNLDWDTRKRNFLRMCQYDHHTIKFTIKDEDDFFVAHDLYNNYIQSDWVGDIYAGVVWGQEYQTRHLAAAILSYKLPWKLNVQVHNYVWPAHERRR